MKFVEPIERNRKFEAMVHPSSGQGGCAELVQIEEKREWNCR